MLQNYESQYTIAPNLAMSDRRGPRYPNQFFDLSQQYMPPTIKELFKWCTFYFYNSPLIGSAIKKMSRYPITDLIVEDSHDSVRTYWKYIFDQCLKIKIKLMEVSLDRHVYGNAFVSLHLPFTRMLKCTECGHSAPLKNWSWTFGSSYKFMGKCSECSHDGELEVRDVKYKDVKQIRLVRWNPENIEIKHNEYTGESVYLYTVPRRLRQAIQVGDKDICGTMPLIVIDAVREQKKIRMNPDNFIHLKEPSLAEQEQGWGKPAIIHVLKDMFYFYTLRRAQEAIALEHIVPFDILYPMPNGQQDPYMHTDLGDWKNKIKSIIDQHRRDPNFKAVIPIPVGFGRLGGDGKALLLGPEIQYITQTVVGGLGIPQEFLFGGLNFTGSSVSLRTLENDFIQARAQMLDLVVWIKDRLRAWLEAPDVANLKFSDFRMADDIQRNQQLIGLNAANKVSDQTMLTELGYDYETEKRKQIEEAYLQNYIAEIFTKGQAKSQGEASLIGFGFQQRVEQLAAQAKNEAQMKMENTFAHDNTGQIQGMVEKLTKLPPPQAEAAIAELKMQVPEVATAIEMAYRTVMSAQKQQAMQMQMVADEQQAAQEQSDQQLQTQMHSQLMSGAVQNALNPTPPGTQSKPSRAGKPKEKEGGIDMRPAPNQKPPRRQGGV